MTSSDIITASSKFEEDMVSENSINNLPRNTPIKSEIKNLHNRIQKARLEKYSDMKIHDFIDLLQRKLLLIDELIDKSYFHNN